MAVEHGWAIASSDGLYIGWWTTRREAIAEHVNAIARTTGRAWGGLSPEQQAEWQKCKRRGDKAVKIKISYSAVTP